MQTRPQIGKKILHNYNKDTRFQIDYEWWEQSDLDLKTFLSSQLDIDTTNLQNSEVNQVDLIDPVTGEVRQIDGFQYMLQAYLNQMGDDFIIHASLVDAIFYILLGNANQPMSADEIARQVHRSPDIVIRTLTGGRVYKGIRPVPDI